jgi:serralysin
LYGGRGDDTYVFGVASSAEADSIFEAEDAGTDTIVFSSLTEDVVLKLGTSVVQSVHNNRTLHLNSSLTVENAIGGSGNDLLLGNSLANRLEGRAGNDILVGQNGDDQLIGGDGRDLLIGGRGVDTLNGGADDDIMIAGRTTSDSLVNRLIDARTEWVSINDYQTRIAKLRQAVGTSNVSLRAKFNVLNDDNDVDALTGSSGNDWYFIAVDDVIVGLLSTEILDVL